MSKMVKEELNNLTENNVVLKKKTAAAARKAEEVRRKHVSAMKTEKLAFFDSFTDFDVTLLLRLKSIILFCSLSS